MDVGRTDAHGRPCSLNRSTSPYSTNRCDVQAAAATFATTSPTALEPWRSTGPGPCCVVERAASLQSRLQNSRFSPRHKSSGPAHGSLQARDGHE
ncbi:hypothetical protein M7I_7197 [Glarea lozoyensis 74030]|uniref:Uncharacterized protein n=1 Tax=Glarea lozoyensis (strain ATCC 74030 / MF5533) TaxID=1104152 RepID=H0EWM6_GLAL7|nr:hypothetical protein M7I_7197 [Glarea lozoyensis 74030]